jgi:hypothetical protein
MAREIVTSETREEFIKKNLNKNKKKNIHYHGSNLEKLKPEENRLFWVTPNKKDAEKYADSTVMKYGGKSTIHEIDLGDQEHKFLTPTQFFRMKAQLGDKEAFEEAKKQGYTAVKTPEGNAMALLHSNHVKLDK